MKLALIALLTVTSLAGCATNTSGLQIDGERQRVIFGQSALDDAFKVTDIATVKVHSHMRGSVTLVNQTTHDQSVQYRFYWYDRQGLEVNIQPSAWKQQIVHGGEKVSLSEVSISPQGQQFRLQIRENNQ
ncbi:YcfL family protein [Vibrio palustris]|uniref:YcfL protein: an outer membrane lipoprotein that is part of a salvage cluster n=1 Tax=Vibrio palustris TaxID=1918946 RepID=A0A1R4B1S3_9VIBR|nr:YcfL family protein [Vibrio palustris]SJL82865.1 hypothetical protein VPAL9027_00806 [Vibrio palustris]